MPFLIWAIGSVVAVAAVVLFARRLIKPAAEASPLTPDEIAHNNAVCMSYEPAMADLPTWEQIADLYPVPADREEDR